MNNIVFDSLMTKIYSDVLKEKEMHVTIEDYIQKLCEYFNVLDDESIFNNLSEIYNDIENDSENYEYRSEYMKNIIKNDLIVKRYGNLMKKDNITEFLKNHKVEEKIDREINDPIWGSFVKRRYAHALLIEIKDFEHILESRNYYNQENIQKEYTR